MKGEFKCSGVNDQIQIQAAIDLLASTGGAVILSDGTFMMSNQISLVSNIILRGQGMEETLLKTIDNCPQFRKAGLIRGIYY
jgi:polygalacturonase